LKHADDTDEALEALHILGSVRRTLAMLHSAIVQPLTEMQTLTPFYIVIAVANKEGGEGTEE